MANSALEQMINHQLLPCGISESTAEHFRQVDRSDLFPPNLKALAYSDQATPYRKGRLSLIPLHEARILQTALERTPFHVLVIAPQFGFIPGVFAHLGIQVTAIDTSAQWISQLQTNPQLKKVHWMSSSLTELKGNLEKFDLVIILDTISQVPSMLLKELRSKSRIISIIRTSAYHAQLGCTELNTGPTHEPTYTRICELSTSALPKRSL